MPPQENYFWQLQMEKSGQKRFTPREQARKITHLIPGIGLGLAYYHYLLGIIFEENTIIRSPRKL